MNFLDLFKRKKVEDDFKDDEDSMFKAHEHYDVKPFDQLHYDLVYAHDDMIHEDSHQTIYVRAYKKYLLKFFFVTDFEYFKTFNFSNENLFKLKGNLVYNYIQDDDFKLPKEINIIIFKEKSEEIKKYCFLNSKASKEARTQYFIFDSSQSRMISYRLLKDYLLEGYKTALFFDLAAIDKEQY